MSLEIPLEISAAEYKDLLESIRTEFSIDECRGELLEACRYDDVDVVRALLLVHGASLVATAVTSGNTPWHMAAGNGHLRIVELLASVTTEGCQVANSVGNTPLHWAAGNGHAAVVDFMSKLEKTDVLQRNQFGRSALTEGFTSDNTDVVKTLLEHESATEERLLTVNNDEAMDEDIHIVHDLVLGGYNVSMRELAMARKEGDKILGQTSATDDTTGLALWAASFVLARWLLEQPVECRTLLELGAGCGLPGIAIAQRLASTKVYVTDWNPDTLENLRVNVDKNNGHGNLEAVSMDWHNPETWPNEDYLDVVVGSDLIYQSDMAGLLYQTVKRLLRPGTGRFFYVAPQTGRQGHDTFLKFMAREFHWKKKDVPPVYRANPLVSQDDDLCFLHFGELQSAELVLYEFSWK